MKIETKTEPQGKEKEDDFDNICKLCFESGKVTIDKELRHVLYP
jgi:hypothetical protein